MSTQKAWDMSLNLFTLNIEGDRHFLRWLPHVTAHTYDVVCLQEVFEADVPLIQQETGLNLTFVPMMSVDQENKYGIAPRGLWGIGLCTNTAVSNVVHAYYYGSAAVRSFHHPRDASRVIVYAEVEKAGVRYRVATTHFTWTEEGASTPAQARDFTNLVATMQHEQDWILCGDFNAPRGGATFSLFTERFTDWLPPSVESTLDPTLHYAGTLDLVVDTIFTTSHYAVTECAVHCGLSDHCGISAKILRL